MSIQQSGVLKRIEGSPSGEIERTAQTVFPDRSEDQAQHDGGRVQIKLANEVADDAENEHDDHFHKVVDE